MSNGEELMRIEHRIDCLATSIEDLHRQMVWCSRLIAGAVLMVTNSNRSIEEQIGLDDLENWIEPEGE